MNKLDEMAKERAALLYENKQHGPKEFPFELYPCTIPGDFDKVPVHFHDNYELIYIKKGTGIIRMGKKDYVATAGDIYFLPPETIHGIFPFQDYRMEYENLIFGREIMLREEEVSKGLPPMQINNRQIGYMELSNTLQRIESLSRFRRTGYETGLRGLLFYFFYELSQIVAEGREEEGRDNIRLKKILAYIETHEKEELRIEQVAAAVGISEGHFMKFFRENTGETYMNYLIRLRLERAAKLLAESDLKILDIAIECDYDNLANFNRQFRRHYQMTPSAYRKRLKNQALSMF